MKTINKTAIVLVATGVIGLGAIGATVIPAMAKHHGEHHGKNYGDKRAKLAEMDTNGDGAVSLDELTAYTATEVKTKFAKIDANGDGAISLDESTAAATAKIEKKFAKMDADGDGKVTKDELKALKRKGKKGKRHHDK